jgi:hypothetical protein
MRLQECLVRQLQLSTTATYAIVGTKVFWSITAKDPNPPFVRIRKVGHRPLTNGLQSRRLPAEMAIEVVAYAKSQEAAADLADAIAADLINYNGLMPSTSPATSGALHVNGIQPGGEEDLVSEEALALNIFAESREYLVRYREA